MAIKDFYMVGGMGHTSSVALGYSLSNKNKTFCIDGDGSFLMHLGSIKTVAKFAEKNYKYILLNNNSHDSVGGQSTNVDTINFKKLSESLGFKEFYSISNKNGLNKTLKNFIKSKNTSFLEVKVTNSKIKKLPRPENLIKIKNEFMKMINSLDDIANYLNDKNFKKIFVLCGKKIIYWFRCK